MLQYHGRLGRGQAAISLVQLSDQMNADPKLPYVWRADPAKDLKGPSDVQLAEAVAMKQLSSLLDDERFAALSTFYVAWRESLPVTRIPGQSPRHGPSWNLATVCRRSDPHTSPHQVSPSSVHSQCALSPGPAGRLGLRCPAGNLNLSGHGRMRSSHKGCAGGLGTSRSTGWSALSG